MIGSRSPTAGHVRASASRERKLRTCSAAAARSPVPDRLIWALSPHWVTRADTDVQSCSLIKRAERTSGSPPAAIAVGVNSSQNRLLVRNDHGPSTGTERACCTIVVLGAGVNGDDVAVGVTE